MNTKNSMKTYQLSSIKGKRTVNVCDLDKAIEAAKAMDKELRPAFGVDIYDSSDQKRATVENGTVDKE